MVRTYLIWFGEGKQVQTIGIPLLYNRTYCFAIQHFLVCIMRHSRSEANKFEFSVASLWRRRLFLLVLLRLLLLRLLFLPLGLIFGWCYFCLKYINNVGFLSQLLKCCSGIEELECRQAGRQTDVSANRI